MAQQDRWAAEKEPELLAALAECDSVSSSKINNVARVAVKFHKVLLQKMFFCSQRFDCVCFHLTVLQTCRALHREMDWRWSNWAAPALCHWFVGFVLFVEFCSRF